MAGLPPPPQSAQERATRSVFVGNIPYEATEEQLKEIFTQAGPVVSFRLVYDRETGKPKGYGFCEYQDIETAQSAMRNLNNYDFSGRPLRVGVAAGEQNRDEIKSLQQATGGIPIESPYGDPVEPEKAPEAISKAVASLPPEQMFELMKQMKVCIQNNPNEARNMLLQNPQLAYALLQAQIVMKIVDPQVAMAMLHRQSDQIPPVKPTEEPAPAPATPMETQPTSTSTSAPAVPASMAAAIQSSGGDFTSRAPTLLGPGPGGVQGDRGNISNLPGMRRDDMMGGGGARVPSSMAGSLPGLDSRSGMGQGAPRDLDMRAGMDQRMMDMRGGPGMDARGMDSRGSGMDSRGSGMDMRGPGMDPRGMGMDMRGQGMDMRGMDPRGPGMNNRGQGMDSRGPMDVRGPGMDVRGPGMDGRGGGGPMDSRNSMDPRGMQRGGPGPGPGGSRGSQGPPTSQGAGVPVSSADQEKAALIMQVLQLSDQQIAMLPPDQRQSIMILKDQISRGSGGPS